VIDAATAPRPRVMFLLHRPTDADIHAFLAAQRQSALSYREGLFAGGAPRGFARDHLRARIGSGERAFALARTALLEWRMFELGWVSLHCAGAPVAPGTTVAVLARHFGFFSLHGCRVLGPLEDEGRRCAFRYGTLADHAERGEERFAVEIDARGDVYYEIEAFSQPRAPLARLGYPVARWLQRCFRRDSGLRMRAVCRDGGRP
jgi:uncharacterized protein (UPF0548 family)